MTEIQVQGKNKGGRPPGARNKSMLERIRSQLPKLQRELLKKALAGDVEAILACHQVVGARKYAAAVNKAQRQQKRKEGNAKQKW